MIIREFQNSKFSRHTVYIVPSTLNFLFKSRSVGVTCCPKLDIFQSVGIMHGKLNGLCTKMWFNRVVFSKTRATLCPLWVQRQNECKWSVYSIVPFSRKNMKISHVLWFLSIIANYVLLNLMHNSILWRLKGGCMIFGEYFNNFAIFSRSLSWKENRIYGFVYEVYWIVYCNLKFFTPFVVKWQEYLLLPCFIHLPIKRRQKWHLPILYCKQKCG